MIWQATLSPVTPLFFSFYIIVFQGYYPTSLTMFSSGFMLLHIFLSLLKCWFSRGSVFLPQPLLVHQTTSFTSMLLITTYLLMTPISRLVNKHFLSIYAILGPILHAEIL